MASKKKNNDRKKKSSVKKPVGLPEVEEEQEEVITFGDKLLKAVAPYISTIAFALIAGFLGFAIIAFLMQGSADKKAMEWRELNNATNIANRSNDISAWKQVAETYPNTKAGLWANQMAGDYQLRLGLEQMTYNRENGKGMIEKAKGFFKTVVDAPDASKTPMLQQASNFALAYAHESLGEFAESQVIYEKLVADTPDSAFANYAKRGAGRASNEDYAELYKKFENWEEEVVGEAPGAKVPKKPIIEFPELPGDLPPGEKPPEMSPTVSGGGDFGEGKPAVEPETGAAVDNPTDLEVTDPAKMPETAGGVEVPAGGVEVPAGGVEVPVGGVEVPPAVTEALEKAKVGEGN